MAVKNADIYKYSTLILGVIVIVLLVSIFSYNSGRNSYATIFTTIQSTQQLTSIQYTTVSSLPSCDASTNGAAQVYVGNSVSCGLFAAELASINSSGVPKVLIYYNGTYTNQYIVGVNGNGGYKGMGQSNVTRLNVSGTALYIWIGGVSITHQTANIEITTSPGIFVTTVP